MPTGTCDPASRGEAYNAGEFAQFGGEVVVTYRYGWDGVSVRPDCVGPVTYLRGRNLSTTNTYYAHFKGRRGTWRMLTMPPGFDETTTNRAQLRSAGFEDNTDLENLYITASSTPPTP